MSKLNEETRPKQFNCNRRVSNFIEVSNLLDPPFPRTSQQIVKKIIQLATVIRAPDQRLKLIEVQDPQYIQHSHSTNSNPLNTTHNVTDKNIPNLEHNLINPHQKLGTQ